MDRISRHRPLLLAVVSSPLEAAQNLFSSWIASVVKQRSGVDKEHIGNVS